MHLFEKIKFWSVVVREKSFHVDTVYEKFGIIPIAKPFIWLLVIVTK